MVNPLLRCVLASALVSVAAGHAWASDPGLYLEPELGSSVVLGSVFCDANGNGRRDEGEAGLGGVDVRADTGTAAATDRGGRFHLRIDRAGQHLIKVDETTVAGAAVPEGGLVKGIHTTVGMLFRVDFAVVCSLDRVGPDSIEAPNQGGEAPKLASTQALASTVLLSGHTSPAQVSLDGHILPVNVSKLDVDFPGGTRVKGGINLSWRPGPLPDPIVLKPEVVSTGGEPGPGASWRIDVRHVGDTTERIVRSFAGSGEPPDSLPWDGTDPDQVFSLLEQGQLYRVILTTTDGHGSMSRSRPVTFGVDYGHGGGVVERLVIRGLLFDDAMRPTKLLRKSLGEMKTLVSENPAARLLVEVHTDDSQDNEISLSRSRKGAFLTAESLTALLAIDRERIDSLGYGSVRPLLPSISERNKAFNRRLEITLLTSTQRATDVTLATPVDPAGVWLQQEKIVVGPDGLFLGTTPRPASGQVAVRMVTAAGASWERVVDLGALGEVAPGAQAQDDPLKAFGGAALRRALGDSLIPGESGDRRDTAGQVEVILPASGSTLKSKWIYVQGSTHPRNTITANGVALEIDPKGRFAQRVPMPVGESALEVASTDELGFVARITRSYTVTEEAFFLMALVDGATQMLGGHLLDDDRANSSWKIGDSIRVGGRAAITFKGRIHGSKLGKDVFILAHLDTAKNPRFEAFHGHHVDPTREYAIFGDESYEDDIHSRGPLYVLVRADRSTLEVGNVRAGMEGMGLVRYDRALYGMLLNLEHSVAEGYTTRIKAFVSEDSARLRRGHDELRATGGSLYHLSSQEILAGSERVQIVRRERDSRLELSRRELRRDEDYRVDYRSGRITLKAPLSSLELTPWSLTTLQPFSTQGRQVHAGHEVWLVVDYESTDLNEDRALAGAVEIRQQISEKVTITGGFVTETRGGDGTYQLYGGGLEAKIDEGTTLRAEYAASSGVDGSSHLSQDGGLRYETLGRTHTEADGTTPKKPKGMALRLELVSDLGRSLGREDLDFKIRSWWQMKDTEFYGIGHLQEQGTEKVGAHMAWKPTKRDAVSLRFDYQTTLVPDNPDFFLDGLREHKRMRASTTYQRTMGRFDLQTEAAWGQHRDAADGVVVQTEGVALGGTWRFRDDLHASVSQQALFDGDDDVLGVGFMPRQTTRLGLGYKANKDVMLGVSQAMRWDGDNATMLSARGKLDERTNAYIGQQLGTGTGAMGNTTVVGAESNQGDGVRSYSEYRLDDGVDGRTNRAVVGVGKRVPVTRGVALTGAYERVQTFGGADGDGARDVISGGLEVLALDWVKFGSRYELRLDRRPLEGESDLGTTVQALALHGLTFTLSRNTSAMLMANFDLTQDLATRQVQREGLELSLAAIHRPRFTDWLTLTGRISRYQRRYALDAADLLLLDGQTVPEQRESIDLIGVGAIMELPANLELTEHAVYRFRKWKSLEGGLLRAQDLLSIHRLGYRVLRYLDIAFEYRLLAMLDTDEALKHGYLTEIAYAPGRHLKTKNPYLRHMRVALGYDFNPVPRALEPTLEDEADGGVYVRITGAF
jgi:hypothetical protein